MSVTVRPFVTAMARTEINSAACRPTIEPPSTTPVAGSDTIFTKPRGSSLMSALACDENGTFVTRTLRPSENASVSAIPTSAISGSVKIAEAACPCDAAGNVPGQEDVEQDSIRISLRNLMTFPWISSRVEAGELHLHGWWVDLLAGRLCAVEPNGGAVHDLVVGQGEFGAAE